MTTVRPSANELPAAEGMIGRIPVRNLWLLMLYASDLFRSQGAGRIAIEESPDEIPDLVAEILVRAVEARLGRHLSTGYQFRNAVVKRIRGRIDVFTTERRQLLALGEAACRFEEMSIDTPRNRFVRGALEHVSGIVSNVELAHRCRAAARILKERGVSVEPVNRRTSAGDQFGRHDAADRPMVEAARLAFDLALPTEVAGYQALPLPEREIEWVRQLFEKAVGGFYATVLDSAEWNVRRGAWLRWQIKEKTPGVERILPSMQTDIILEQRSTARRIVVDTKFTSIVTNGRYREVVRSGYLYQMYAYLRSQAGQGDVMADNAGGVLLHPSIGEDVDETAVIQGHPIRFVTVDLTAGTSRIREELLRVCR